jgi:NAD(P)-dependent dehydrogenase (short-subunit alcohol dehydrogenase family)
MSQRLRDKRCLIVGGTSGIGLAAARRFLEEGAKLVVVGRADGLAEDAREQLRVFGDVRFLSCDAADSFQVEALFAQTIQELGGLDVLYHVAGMSGRRFGDGRLHECSDAGWKATLDANLSCVFLTNRAAVRQFIAQGTGGAILNMASVLAFSPSSKFFDTIAYAAAKGGVVALSRGAAASYAPDKIRVNVIAPGLIDTPMAARACRDESIVSFLRTKQPLTQGAGSPTDCDDVAVFLCSDEARFITGVVLPIDGGWSVSDGQWEDPPPRQK